MNQDMGMEPSSKLVRVSNILENKAYHLVVLAVIIYTITFSYFTILKYFCFQTYAADLGLYEQSLWSTLNGFFLYDTVEFGIHFRSHFDPILLLLLPIYKIYPSPLTLLVLQSLFLALGAFPVYRLAEYELKSRQSGLVFALLYLIYPPLQGINWYDFHPECLAPVLLISAFYYMKKNTKTKKDYLIYFALLVLALSTKELIALIVAFMGLYGFWVNRRKIISCLRSSPRTLLTDKAVVVSTLTILLGIGWYILAGKVIAMYNIFYGFQEFAWWTYLGLGVGLPGILISVITRPLYVWQIMFIIPFSAVNKAFYLFVLLGPLAFLSLLNPMSLLISTPWLFASLLSPLYNHYVPVGTQYPALLMPFIFISAIYGAKALQPAVRRMFSYLDKEKPNSRLHERIMLKTVRKFVEKPILVILIILITTSVLFFVAYTPINSAPRFTAHNQVLEAVAQTIPPGTLVATQNDIFPHLSHNLLAFSTYYKEIPFEFILVDTLSPWYYAPPFKMSDVPLTSVSFSSAVPDLISSGEYGIVISINGIMLLAWGYSGPPLIQI
nr:DUF2079 domain-containing protein [Candidatus Freyarchaeota archaeon]